MKSKYFRIEEFVSREVFEKYGDFSWHFIDNKLIETMDCIKEKTGWTITINDWYWGGRSPQRGLRENTSPIVKGKTNVNKIYLSAHCLGKAVDFDVKGWLAHEVRDWLYEHKDILPYNIRFEAHVPWIHLDVFDMNEKIYFFNA